MARNAEMERQFIRGGDIDPECYEKGPEGQKWETVKTDLMLLRSNLNILHRAAGFNPKAPLGKE